MEGAGSENEVLLGAIFQTTAVAIGVSRNGVHRLVNPAYLRMFGYDDAEELVGTPILPLVAPEERERIAEKVRRRTAGLEPEGVYVTRGLRRDGVAFDMEVQVANYTFAGEIYTLVLLRDVTEERAAHAALRDGHEFYRALFEQNTAVKFLTDPETLCLVDANDAAAAFYGYPRERLRGAPLSLLNPMQPADMRPAVAAILAGNLRSFTIPHRLADGRMRTVEVHSGPVRVGGRTLMFSIVHDVTDRAELEAQLRQSQKMEAVGQLAGGLAHDFNNLLTVVTGHAELLERRAESDQLRHHAAEIRRHAMRAEDLTRQLLAFSRRQVMQPRVLDLAEAVRELEGLVRRLVGERVDLVVDAKPGRWVAADPGQIQQVVLNLAVNARDAMPDGGKLLLRVGELQAPTPAAPDGLPAGDWAVLEVTDTGHGMDDATRARVFEPFFTTKDKQKGTGLGLATVYGIVSQSGGRVTVRSAPGEGATFTVLLARVPRPERAPEPPPSVPPVEAGRPGRHVLLLAEDDDGVRGFLRERLSGMGYTVLDGRDGEDALRVARAYPGVIHALVTDVVMPRLTGPALYDALAAERPGLKVVFVSGYADGLLSREQLDRTGGVFLAKPFTGRALEALLVKLLGA
ncbi:MAG: PAS domain S-box protein [Myxococcota bacterium]